VGCFQTEPDAALVPRVHEGGALAAWQAGPAAFVRRTNEWRSLPSQAAERFVLHARSAGARFDMTMPLADIAPALANMATEAVGITFPHQSRLRSVSSRGSA
jgi:hypothetical protein